MPPTVTVDAGPSSPGVKPLTTPGVLVSAGGGAGAAAGGGGGAAAGALLAEPLGELEFDDGAPVNSGAGAAPDAGAALDELDSEEALYAPAVGPVALPGMPPLELDIIAGPGPSGTVFAVCIAGGGLVVEFALRDAATALGGGRFRDAAIGLKPAGPDEPLVVNGTQARFDLLLA